MFEHKAMAGRLSIQNPALSFTHLICASYDHCIIQDLPPADGSNTVTELYLLPIEFVSPSQQSANSVILCFNPFVTYKWMYKIKSQEKPTFRHSSWSLSNKRQSWRFSKALRNTLCHLSPLSSLVTRWSLSFPGCFHWTLASGHWHLAQW